MAVVWAECPANSKKDVFPMTDRELIDKIYWLSYSMHADTPLDEMQVIQAIRKAVLDHEKQQGRNQHKFIPEVNNKFARHKII